MASSSKRDARRVATKSWRAEALRLRVDRSLTIREIAKRLGKAPSTVHDGIEAEIAEIPAEAVKLLRRVHGEQLDAVIRGALPRALKGDARAAKSVVAAITAKAKLLGLNSVEKLNVGGELSLTLDARAELLQRLTQLAKGAKK